MLLPTTSALNLTFQIKTPEKTIVPNTITTITKDGNTINKYPTDSEGTITISLNPDQNTARYTLNFTYLGTTYDWNGTIVTINIPKKESSPATNITPFEISIDGIANYYSENLTTTQTIILWSDLKILNDYSITIGDWNDSIYSDRTYSRVYSGLQTTDTIQPYLLTVEESTAVKFTVQDEFRINIPEVTIEIYKIISGELVEVASSLTDVTGTSLFWLAAGDRYGIKMYYKGTLVFETDNYVVKTSQTYFYINLQSFEVVSPGTDNIYISYKPITEYLGPSITELVYTIRGENVTGYYINSYYLEDNNRYASRTYTYYGDLISCVDSCEETILLSTLNLDANQHVFFTELIIVVNDVNNYFTKRWYKPSSPSMNMHVLFLNSRIDFGCPTDPNVPCGLTMIVSIVLTVLVVGGIIFKFGFVNGPGIIIIALGVLGLLTWVGWFFFPLYVLLMIVGIIVIGKGVIE